MLEILKTKEKKDLTDLKDLSEEEVRSSAIYQDADVLSVATLLFSLYKIMEREEIDKAAYKRIQSNFKKTISYLKLHNINQYREMIKTFFEMIKGIDEEISRFIEEVLVKAKIVGGSVLYEQGISLTRAADLLGITQWELMNYVGKTNLSDIEPISNVKERLFFARRIFKPEK